jgi:hypothetical protein
LPATGSLATFLSEGCSIGSNTLPMKTSAFFCSAAFLLASSALHASEKPLYLAVEGKLLYENKFDSEHGAQWKSPKGAWEISGGVLRGSEKPEDNHGAVTRLPDKLSDFVIEYDFKFEGAKATTLSLNAAKGHLARIAITPKSVAIQKDDMDHAGPDKAVVFARFSADFQPGVWHTVRMEMVGDTLLGKVNGYIAWGASDVFKQERIAPGLTVGGQSVEFRNLRIFEASLNPRWSEVQAALPKPGEKMDAPPARPPGAKAATGVQ